MGNKTPAKRRRGRPRLPWAKKRHRVSLRVRGDVIQAFKQRYGANWRKAMAEFLDAAVERLE